MGEEPWALHVINSKGIIFSGLAWTSHHGSAGGSQPGVGTGSSPGCLLTVIPCGVALALWGGTEVFRIHWVLESGQQEAYLPGAPGAAPSTCEGCEEELRALLDRCPHLSQSSALGIIHPARLGSSGACRPRGWAGVLPVHRGH